LASALVKIARMAPPGSRPLMLAAVHFSGGGSRSALAARVQRLTQTDPRHPLHSSSGSKYGPAVFFGALGVLLTAAVWCACNTPALLLVHRALEHIVALLA
jgi:hypothetical protein